MVLTKCIGVGEFLSQGYGDVRLVKFTRRLSIRAIAAALKAVIPRRQSVTSSRLLRKKDCVQLSMPWDDAGLDDFEKSLAAEKAAREQEDESKERKHRHHHHRHRSPHYRSRDEERDERDDEHRHKRSRHSRHNDEDDRRSERRPRDEKDKHRRRRSRDDDSHERRRSRGHNEERRKSGRSRNDAEQDNQSRESSEKLADLADIPTVSDEASAPRATAKRDAWMTDPAALGVDFTQRGARKVDAPRLNSRPDYDLKIHKNELNHRLREELSGQEKEIANEPAQHEVSYTFGDAGSSWRMTKLKAVYDQAKASGRSVDDVALERYGDLRDFDDAREEEIELERRKLYGPGYVGKEKPSGELFQERKMDMGIRREHSREDDQVPIVGDNLPQGKVVESTSTPLIDQTTLNKMKAAMMKAKLKGAPDAAKLEEEYNRAAASFANQPPEVVTLGVMDSRMLAGTRGEVKSIDNKRGRERGLVESNEDMTIEEMVQEERRSKGQRGGEAARFAERIAKDVKFDDSLDYLDENSDKLAKRVQKSEINLKNSSIAEYQKTTRILDNCPLCHHEDRNLPPAAPMVSLATRVYLTLPTEPELSEGGAVIVPIQHRTNLLECDDDEWEEMRNFMKCLTRMYHDQGRDVVFYENAAAPQRKLHAAMVAVPLPYEVGEMAAAFFREAILSSDEEWSQHKKIIDTAKRAKDGLGKMAFRRSIAKEMPYFHVWFELDGGIGHVVEDAGRWPKGDLFAREIIGGILDREPDVVKRQGRWTRGVDRRVEGFQKRWRKFDWTRVLTDGQ